MNYRHFKYEGWLYGLAFLLALGLRLIGLGLLSLNDTEADLALQALQVAQGLKPALGPHPAYIMSTTLLFFLYGGGTNFLARLTPALVGSALVFAPLLFADRLKPRPAVLLAFFIAVDPGLTGSPIMAITFALFALGCINQKKPQIAAGFAALALLGGPAIWAGLLALGITWAIYQALAPRFFLQGEATDTSTIDFKETLIPLAVTLVVAGTLFFTVPNGLSAALASFPAYVSGWFSFAGLRVTWMLLALLVYESFAILLSMVAIARGWKDRSRRVLPLSLWLIVALLLAIFYPARRVADLAWTLIPLLSLAALELARYLDVRREERNEAIGAILLTAFLWLFGWLNFSALVWLAPGQPGYSLRLWLVLGSFILLAFSLMLVAYGWSTRIAQLGAVWGLGLALMVLSLSSTLGSAGLHGMAHPELWWQQNIPVQTRLLDSTIDDLSEWGRGYDNALPVVIYGVRSRALEWALREHHPVVVDTLDIGSSPEIVITTDAGDPNLAASYRGQDFVWRLTTSWEVAGPVDWLRWLVYREMTQSGENIILWAREDLFINAAHPSNTP